MTPSEATATALEAARARHLTASSINHLHYILKTFSAWCHAHDLHDLRDATPSTLTDFHTSMKRRKRSDGQPLSTKYINRHVRTIKGLFKLLADHNHILTDIGRNFPPLTNPQTLPRGIMNKEQIMKLLAQPPVTTPLGFRDRTMLELLYSTGIRARELCRLTLYDINHTDRTLRILHGKGNKDRIVPFGKIALSFLTEYIKRIRPLLLAESASALVFITATGYHLRTHDLGRIVKKYRDRAGLPDDITTHSIRHTCATEMLKGGASIRHVQELLGHADIATTQIYTHVVQSDLKKAHARTAPSERRKTIDVPTFDTQTPSWNDNRNAEYWPLVHSGKRKQAENDKKQ